VAIGTVTRAKKRGRFGRAGKLDISLDTIRLPNGEKVPLRATIESKGKGSTGVMTGAIIATSILFFQSSSNILFLMKGKDVTLPKGTEVTAYVAGDITINPKTFSNSTNNSATTNNGINSAKDAGSEELTIKVNSTPQGADIMINGKFVGNTPSAIRLKTGDYFIMIRKNGFNTWERSLSLMSVMSGSEISLNADLEKAKE